jgi:HEAT repeat protein
MLDVFRSAPTSVRREIIGNLPSIVDGNGYSIVKEAIVDVDGHVRGGAVVAAGIKAIAELEPEVQRLAESGFFDVRIKAMKALINIDLQSAMTLIARFADAGSVEDKKVYLAVAETLNGEENFRFIRNLLSDKDEGVRRASVRVMGNFLGDERYATLFESLLMKRDIPHEVLKVIKEQKLVWFRGRLVEIFTDESQGLWTRYYALAALGSFEDHDLFETFVTGLDDENSLIKIGSLKALSDLADAGAIEHVRSLAMSSDEDVRSTAQFVMEKLESIW